ncbi:NAD(P)H-dependent oxidoreductase [Puia sp. P3]|uniref:NAD(P)H-dependent oxidoreductase n=1 Tax=Puia sp. P3 TaxID=3423952 RepID=UPI003D671F9F
MVYESASPMGTRRSSNSQNSFFAGHVALVGTSMFFIAQAYADYHPESRYKWAFYTGAGVVTGLTALWRNKAGEHFPSDIALGSVVGVASGLLTPMLHRTKIIRNKKLSILPFTSSGRASRCSITCKLHPSPGSPIPFVIRPTPNPGGDRYLHAMPRNILAISGSIRKTSVNNAILNYIHTIHNIHVFDITTLPYFNPDLTDPENLPQTVKTFLSQIAAADGVILCTPEYVFTIPGILKNAIEWCVASTVFQDKPLAMIVASLSGQKAFESLDLVMTTVGARATEDTKLLLSGAYGKLDKATHALDSHTITLLDQLMNSFLRLLLRR